MKAESYRLGSRGIRIVHLSDLHNRPYRGILAQVRELRPDWIVVTGDICHRYDGSSRAGGFLSGCCDIAPTFVSLGNHDSLNNPRFRQALADSGARLLDNCYVELSCKGHTLRIGGLTCPTSYLPRARRRWRPLLRRGRILRRPDLSWLEDFCHSECDRILLCHQPEYYPWFLRKYPLELMLSGHAHGGQWRIGSQGIFAPGQGFLPKLTGGVTPIAQGNLVISRGLSNPTPIPRFFNPREIVVVEL